MKNIRLFQTQTEFDNSEKVYPQISYVEENGEITVGKPQGVFILGIDKELYKTEEWNKPNEQAVGVAVLSGDFEFVIAPNAVDGNNPGWGTQDALITGCTTTTDEATALKDNNGEANTDAIIKQDPNRTNTSAGDSRTYTFINGAKGYLGTAGEWNVVHKNFLEIEKALQRINGSTLKDYHWTSTQYDKDSGWAFHYHKGVFTSHKGQYGIADCRPFGRL